MDNPIGKPLPQAKPIVMTFYDYLQDYAYTSTFYVREETSVEDCQELIRAVCGLSECVLAKYKIGHQPFVIPDYQKNFESMRKGVMGTTKWSISYHNPNGAIRSHTIPGRNVEHSIPHSSKIPNRNHPVWQAFLTVFSKLCVSKEGDPIPTYFKLDYTASNWPPKGHKRKR